MLLDELSPRQREVAELVFQGLTNKEVGNKLFICEQAVKMHLIKIYKIFGVNSRTQMMRKIIDERRSKWSLPRS